MQVSDHAELRVGQRVDKRCVPQDVCEELWRHGRTATPHDFERFAVYQQPYYRYRVGLRNRVLFMVVLDSRNQTFVTLVKRPK